MLNLDRRNVLLGGAGVLALAACGRAGAAAKYDASAEARFANSPFRKISDAEWKKKLPNDSYWIMRKEDTEPAGTGPLLNEHRNGTFYCRGCDLPLFKSEWKFESGTGWPSFFKAIEGNVAYKVDRSVGMVRTEYHCAQCLAHHGHLFDDGPKPTGLRYCNNGWALKFVAA